MVACLFVPFGLVCVLLYISSDVGNLRPWGSTLQRVLNYKARKEEGNGPAWLLSDQLLDFERSLWLLFRLEMLVRLVTSRIVKLQHIDEHARPETSQTCTKSRNVLQSFEPGHESDCFEGPCSSSIQLLVPSLDCFETLRKISMLNKFQLGDSCLTTLGCCWPYLL